MDTHDLSTCAACRIIDRADGVEDGQIGKVDHYLTRHERWLTTKLLEVQDHAADTITTFAGSMKFVYIHIAWFGVWVALNVGLMGALGHPFDKFPFGLLTMIVSLEAIFLSTFVMVSQNRQAARQDVRSQLDFENNIRSEIWAIHIGQALNLDLAHVEEIVGQALASAEAAMNRHSGGANRGSQDSAKG
jgi:uncharacterized membrane protein